MRYGIHPYRIFLPIWLANGATIYARVMPMHYDKFLVNNKPRIPKGFGEVVSILQKTDKGVKIVRKKKELPT